MNPLYFVVKVGKRVIVGINLFLKGFCGVNASIWTLCLLSSSKFLFLGNLNFERLLATCGMSLNCLTKSQASILVQLDC